MPSREPELYKDKVEVSLDGRQIFYLFFGGAVLVGMVFVLGVMVGRRVESRSHVDRLDHAQGTRDPLAALDGLEGKKLTFQSALVKTDPKTEVEHQIDQIEAKAKEPEKKPAAPVADKPEKTDKIEKPADKKADDAKKPKDDKAKKDDKARKDGGEPITKPDQAMAAPKKIEKADKAKKIDDTAINGDVVTAMDPPINAKPEAKVADAKAETKGGKFTLQLSSFQDRHEADNFLSSVKAAGYQAYVTEAEVSGKGTFYRVRLGTYRSLEAANDAKADVEKSLKKTASVMRL